MIRMFRIWRAKRRTLQLTRDMIVNDPARTITRRVQRERARKAHWDSRAEECREARLRFVRSVA